MIWMDKNMNPTVDLAKYVPKKPVFTSIENICLLSRNQDTHDARE